MPQPFNSAVMTNDGARLLTGAQAGGPAPQFTRIAIGDGAYSDNEKEPASLQGKSELKSLKNSYRISSIKAISDHAVKVVVLITNQDPVTKEGIISEGYYINEIGIYAKPSGSENSDEILYSIAVTSAENGDFMPPYNGHNPVQITQEYYVAVNNSGEVTIQASAGAVALAEDLEALKQEVDGKQDAEQGKGLSTEDYTTEEKQKLSNIEEEANKTVVDSELSSESENPVQNKVVDAAIKALGAAVIISDTAPSQTDNVLWVQPGGST